MVAKKNLAEKYFTRVERSKEEINDLDITIPAFNLL
jgi:hypothetical protein